MEKQNSLRLPSEPDFNRLEIARRARAKLKSFLRKAVKGLKPMLDASALTENLAQRDELANKLIYKNYSTIKYTSIFRCTQCCLWHTPDRRRSRVHWNSERGCLEVFRICRACLYVCRKMNVELRWLDPPKPRLPKLPVRNRRIK